MKDHLNLLSTLYLRPVTSSLASVPKPDFTAQLNDQLRHSPTLSDQQVENIVRQNDLIKRMTQQIKDLERECEEIEAQNILVDMETKDFYTKHHKTLTDKNQLEETQRKNQEILKSLQKVFPT